MTGITCNLYITYIYIFIYTFYNPFQVFPSYSNDFGYHITVEKKDLPTKKNCIKVGSYGNSYHFAAVAGIARRDEFREYC